MAFKKNIREGPMLYKTIVFSVLICVVTLTSDAFSLPLPSAPHYSPKGPKPPNTSKKPTKNLLKPASRRLPRMVVWAAPQLRFNGAMTNKGKDIDAQNRSLANNYFPNSSKKMLVLISMDPV